MTYDDQHDDAGADAQHRPQPRIERIPDYRDDLDVSDEEDGFYARDDDFLIPPKVQAAFTRTTDRIPRRIKRYAVVYLAVAFLALVSWLAYFGPRRAAYWAEISLMDHTPAKSYGSNVRPEFNGMIQVRDMDEQHLPTKHSRLVFVGDVHGCREELEHLLKKLDFDRKHDHLVLTGDMIAKGPDSAGVIKLAQKINASCVRGNWEDKLLLSLADAEARHILQPGPNEDPTATIDFLDEVSHSHGDYELRKLAKEFTRKEIEYLHQCPVILRVGSVPTLGNLVSVHAGLVPDKPLEHQDPFHVMNMRTIDLKTRIPSSKHAGTPWEKFWNHRQRKLKPEERMTVVYGHNRKKGLNVREFTYGLDTGCVSGGKLTALVVDGHGGTEIVHVKCGKEGGYDEE
ncbi:serine/threonine protein phosphatase [Decorospora gaudefroyi]|uniref:Serine/threonine protein phosphatase n=1 Tax=Decorospora gaudefroyi TaxID=184978 RepID=A0A6A5K4Y9_9PLEO|nr:serine/threonine protein phosphatase [Decorospora gaudefroyi]